MTGALTAPFPTSSSPDTGGAGTAAGHLEANEPGMPTSPAADSLSPLRNRKAKLAYEELAMRGGSVAIGQLGSNSPAKNFKEGQLSEPSE